MSLRVVLILSVAVAALSSPAPATDGTWTGTASGIWSDIGNWSGTIADGATFTADLSTIDQTGDITVTIDGAVASRTLGILTVGDANNTHSYILAGSDGGTLTLDNYGSAAQLNQVATSKGDTLDASLPIILGSNLEIKNSSANGLAVNGGVSAGFAGAKIISNLGTGTGDVTLGGNITDGTGRVYINQNSANSPLVLSGTNTYTGWTTITNGALRISNANALSANSCLIFSGGVLEASGTFARDINNLRGKVYWAGNGGFAAYGGDLTVTLNGGGPIDWNNNPQGFAGKTLILGSATATNNVTMTNNIDLKGNRTIQVNDNTDSEADVAEFSGVIADGDTTARQLTKTGTGVLILSGANTYSSNTNINGGILRITAAGSNSSAGATIVGNGATLQMAGGTLASGNLQFNSTSSIEAYGAARSIDNTVVWNGNFKFVGTQDLNFTSTTAIISNNRTITVDNTGVTTFSAPLTYNNTCVFNFSDGSGNLVLDGNSTLTGGNRQFTVNATGTAGVLLVNGDVLQDVIGRQLTMAGTGTMVLAGDNDYSGQTNVNGGFLRITGSNSSSGHTYINNATLQLGADNCLASGNLYFNNANNSKIEAYGAARSISNNLVWSQNWRVVGSQDLRFTSTTAVATGGKTVYFDGTGDTTFDTPWTYNGNSTFNFADGSGDANVAGVVTMTGASRTVTVNPTGTAGSLIFSGGVAQDVAGRALTKAGTGVLVLGGTSSYTGATTVNAGTLKVTGSLDASTVVVSNAGTVLAGGGSVKALTMNANTILSPGDSVGDLDVVAGNCSLAATAIYEWELGSGGNDVVDITAGDLTLTDGWILKLVDAGGTPDALTQYNLFTYSGTCTLGTYTIDNTGVTWDVSVASIVNNGSGLVYITGIAPAGELAAPGIPEPATAMLLVFGAAAMLRRRRISGAA